MEIDSWGKENRVTREGFDLLLAQLDADRNRAGEKYENLRRKLINHEAASLRALAQSHGRNVDWADRAVRVATNATATEALKLDVIDAVAPTLASLLERQGVKPIDTSGKFDPHVHEALLSQPSEAEEGSVIDVVQKGYTLGDRVVRPARVVVAAPLGGSDG